MQTIYLNIGSNKGLREDNIRQAVEMLTRHPLLAEGRLRCSPPVYSNPVGYVSDAEFVNIGVAVDFDEPTSMPDPFALLEATQSIERQIAPDSPHRNADGSYRDRAVDIDIIAIDGVTVDSETLTLPHPRAAARNFVTEPLRFLASYDPLTSCQNGRHVKKTVDQMGRDTVETFRSKPKKPVAVILDNIRSQNNVGSIFRTADAFCVDMVALCGITATPPSPLIHKTALGAEDSVAWRHYDTTMQAVEALKAEGYVILCLEQVHDSVSLDIFRPDSDGKYAVIVGNEVDGVAQSVVDAADICLEIPQAGTKHSLNVSVSAAIALWHLFTRLPVSDR